MGEFTGIDWTDHTFNPWWGCTIVNEDCWNCYAKDTSKRYGFDLWGPGKVRRTFGEKHWNEPLKWNAAAEKEGVRHRVFCASMADVFDEDAPVSEFLRLWGLIDRTPFLDWQILTKRPERMRIFMAMQPLRPNVWCIVSAGNQERLDMFAPILETVNARIRGVSWEPSLGPISVRKYPWLNWVIGGDESGAKHRPAKEEWYRSVRDECLDLGIAFFLKQFIRNGKKVHTPELDGRSWTEYPIARVSQ